MRYLDIRFDHVGHQLQLALVSQTVKRTMQVDKREALLFLRYTLKVPRDACCVMVDGAEWSA